MNYIKIKEVNMPTSPSTLIKSNIRKVNHLNNEVIITQNTKIISSNMIGSKNAIHMPNQHKRQTQQEYMNLCRQSGIKENKQSRIKSTYSPSYSPSYYASKSPSERVESLRIKTQYNSPTVVIKKSTIVVQPGNNYPNNLTDNYNQNNRIITREIVYPEKQRTKSSILVESFDKQQQNSQNSKIRKDGKENYPYPIAQNLNSVQKVSSAIRRMNIPSLYTSPEDTYQGQFNNLHQFHGKGIYHFNACNIIYEGEFYQGQIHGHGKLIYQRPVSNIYPLIYQGSFKLAAKNGQGIFYYGLKNHYYKGQWVNDMKQGYGIYQSNEQMYDGCWSKNKKHGQGCLVTFPNKTEFRGTFYDDYFTSGSIKYSNSDTYNGSFYLGKKEGFGTYTYHSRNQQYNGQFSNDLRHGKGSLKTTNGDQFTGTWRHGRIDQTMTCSYKWKDGSVFKGWFKNGKPDKGTIRSLQDEQYQYTSTASFITY